MSLNNVLPFWFFELDSILKKCETCTPEERPGIYAEAQKKLEDSESIPNNVKRLWIKKIKSGFVGIDTIKC